MSPTDRPLRVAVVAEYYPRPAHSAWGIWAHRQALAVRELGVEPRVLALDRPLPSLHALRSLAPGRNRRPTVAPLRQWLAGVRALPRQTTLDGIDIHYVRFFSPPRPISYQSWGGWAARPLAGALAQLDREWPFDLVHAHYAIPAGDAAGRWLRANRPELPLAVSVHGGDLSYAAARSRRGSARVAAVLRGASAVVANSELTRTGLEELTGPLEHLTVIHPGADLPARLGDRHRQPTLVTLAHLESHKNQEAVLRALATLAGRHPDLRYLLIGDGPDRGRLERLAGSLGVAERVSFAGKLAHRQALDELGRCHVHVMPSVHDAFGVAHIEAMAAGLVTIAGAGTGAADIAAAGEGALLVPAGDQSAITRAIDRLLCDRDELDRLGRAARQTVARSFSWETCGQRTLELYERLAGGSARHRGRIDS